MASTEERLRVFEQSLLDEIGEGSSNGADNAPPPPPGDTRPPHPPPPDATAESRQRAQELATTLSRLLNFMDAAVANGQLDDYQTLHREFRNAQTSGGWAQLLANPDRETSNALADIRDRLTGAEQRYQDKKLQARTKRTPKKFPPPKTSRKDTAPPGEVVKVELTEDRLKDEFVVAGAIIDRALEDIGRGVSKPPADLQAEVYAVVAYNNLDKVFTISQSIAAAQLRSMTAMERRLNAYRTRYAEVTRPADTVPPLDQTLTPPADTPATLEDRLNAAREKYAKAEKRLQSVTSIVGRLKGVLGGPSKATVEAEYADAEEKYKELRAEFVAASAVKFFYEKSKLLEQQLDAARAGKGNPRKLYEMYKGLSNYNVAAGVEWTGKKLGKDWKVENRFAKAALRTMNVRTAASVGLLAGGIWLGGASAAGLMAVGLRRGLSGTSGAVGSYDLMNMARMGASRAVIRDSLRLNLRSDELERHMAAIEAKALLDGKTIDDLKNDELYQELLAQQHQAMSFKAADTLGSLDWDRVDDASEADYNRIEAAIEVVRDLIRDEHKLTHDPEFRSLMDERARWYAVEKFKQDPEAAAKLLQDSLDSTNQTLRGKLKTEKNIRRGTMAVSAGVGYLVGSGEVARYIGSTRAGKVAGRIARDLYHGVIGAPVVEAAAPSGGASSTSGRSGIRPEGAPRSAPSRPEVGGRSGSPRVDTANPAGSKPEAVTRGGAASTPAQTGVRPDLAGRQFDPTGTKAQIPAVESGMPKTYELGQKMTLEVTGHKGVLKIGEGGGGSFEEALRDLKKANSDLYNKVIAKLQLDDYDFKGEAGGLIHRKVTALTEGFENDPNWIKTGAIEIDMDSGEIKIHEAEIDYAKAPVAEVADDGSGADTNTDTETDRVVNQDDEYNPSQLSGDEVTGTEAGLGPEDASSDMDAAAEGTAAPAATQPVEARAPQAPNAAAETSAPQPGAPQEPDAMDDLSDDEVRRANAQASGKAYELKESSAPQRVEASQGEGSRSLRSASATTEASAPKQPPASSGELSDSEKAKVIRDLDARGRAMRSAELLLDEGKLNEALHTVLNKSEYGTFMKQELGVTAKALNTIKDMTSEEFLDEFYYNEKFRKPFGKFREFIEDMLDGAPSLRDKKILNIVLSTAVYWKGIH